ncbi:ATP-binding protein [Oharaeibacter diazotrophicus]|uniref:histidine kinase n=1 Tax=Oharaeibacter diazotrophicus TaxID=1920512 RepID=A0A4V3CVG4_9HYPH|nr:ATP-binding protein [Oharaeibacter diazotrophicus]TDP82358.1 signal transduction histidine kinase [Oharaeibacter diazotrophicus]BBE72879.1 autoinducer 2 sensor kinase/phosphatase LuxQ [Pleomorphomonas sp. SM30]GLS76917.1 hybrid sensor histidine kinase/response regulator [Oharaeibacter diazotrophicus]
MSGQQRILPVRRHYNQFVANETLEDYALRFTARRARRWSCQQVAQTAIGAISFLALEAIGGTITLAYGFTNAVAAILVAGAAIFLASLPIGRYAARHGVDIDLLTRGGGFGYVGSTVTSLIYASFTFILFAIEASIMATALEICLGVPLWLGYVLSSLAVIPLVTHGIALISRFQLGTQPLWIVLNLLPLPFILGHDPGAVAAWTGFPGLQDAGADGSGFDLLRFGAAASVILALLPQIGEQVDILRFLPVRTAKNAKSWTFAWLAAGPGWIVLGIPKLLFGSFLAVVALEAGVAPEHAAEPATMYNAAFAAVFSSNGMVLAATVLLVVVSQLKINVMNAYAGSLAWSNFFSRLTHSHPGRVVWLVFNVSIALLLMELGIYRALEQTLGLFAIAAVSWLGTVAADLGINKPLGLSPPGIEFKRAHLYDVNPVGVGSMVAAMAAALVALSGVLGPAAHALAPFVALATTLVAAPAIAAATRGRYALARKPRRSYALKPAIRCSICENAFESEDTSFCPAYSGPICSLCCTLDARCHDVCKPEARFEAQVTAGLSALLPAALGRRVDPALVQYGGGLALSAGVIALVLTLIWVQVPKTDPALGATIAGALWGAFFVLLVVAGIVTWFFVLAQSSRRVAEEETRRQTTLLLDEIEAHKRTDAALQKAKEAAEAANLAKSRYVVGLSHELRTPLNAVLGYAQLLEADPLVPEIRRGRVALIRKSAEHLARLIEGLLDISKIEAGRLQIQRAEVRVADLVDPLVEMFALQAREKGLAFHYERAPTVPEVVRTDEKRLRQVLINLLSNAVKFTREGSVTLSVAYRSQTATITVADTGVGIDPEDAARVFEPFERGARPEALAVPGLGLGLTITKMLVELMGGDIRLTSRPGEGSSFRVRLMMTAVDAPGAAVQPKRPVTGYRGPRRTIMVVDDDANQRALMRDVLGPLGFVVLEATDAASCRNLTEAVSPDLFLLDVTMPGEDGWSLARSLRARGQGGRIMMVSAHLVDADAPTGEDAAHDATLPKPFALARLIERIGQFLDLDWIEEEPAPAAPDAAVAAPATGALAGGDVEDLIRFGRIGYLKGIEARLDGIGADGGPLVGELRALVDRFDFKGFVRRLEAHRDGA